MENNITLEKIEKYFKITESALKEVKKHIIPGKELHAKEIIISQMQNTSRRKKIM